MIKLEQRKKMRIYNILIAFVLLSGCVSIPHGVQPVKQFEVERYLGKWYEIARLDHSFERGLEQISAEYSIREDGGVKVVNRGFSIEKNAWKSAEGKAYFVENVDTGYLKVSFFGPFYGAYVIFELDKTNYQYAFVSGPDKSYLWFLSRSPQVSEALMEKFITQAERLGFDTSKLIYVNQN